MTEVAGDIEIVFVCTANRFRSPIAAALLRNELGDSPVDIRSRGTLDVGAMPPLIQALQLAPRYGIDVSKHRARTIARGELAKADLVIGFERAHVVAAIEHGAAPQAAAFTLPEIVELLERLDARPTSPRELVQAANDLRGAGEPESAPEIADPIGKPAREFQRIAEQIHELVSRLARELSADAG